MGSALDITKARDQAILRQKRGLLVDCGVIDSFLDPQNTNKLLERNYLPRFKPDDRLAQVKRLFRDKPKPYVTFSTIVEYLNFGRGSEPAGSAILEVLKPAFQIAPPTQDIAEEALKVYVKHLEKFPTNEAKLRGAADVYTATVARLRTLVVVTSDFDDFEKIEGVEYVVGWR